MAAKAPVYDYSKARESASSAVPEPAAAAVGETVVEAASESRTPSDKPARPSVKQRARKKGRAVAARPSLRAKPAKAEKRPSRTEGEPAGEAPEARSAADRVRSDRKRGARPASSRTAPSQREGARSGETRRKLGGRGERPHEGQRAAAAGKREGRTTSARPEGAAAPRKGAPSQAAPRSKAQAKPSAGDLPSFIIESILNLVTLGVEFLKKPHSKRFNRTVVAVLCVAVALAFVYPSAADYYIAIRNNAKSEAEYAALQDYYNELKDDVETLNSDEGVEDAARDRYGMIMPGDVAMNVKNLDSEADFDKNPTEIGITPAGSVKAPEEWYTPFLDFFFGYEG